jgi:hypothetical protein
MARQDRAAKRRAARILVEGEEDWVRTHLFLVHLLLDRRGHDQAIHHHVFFLADAECAVHGLSVLSGVPRGVEDNNPVCT